MAEGVLPVLLGRATRLADYIQSGRKTYVADVRLGIATETDDREGAVISEARVPSLVSPQIEAALSAFRGEIQQIPPKYSALKVAGRRAYAIARGGGDVDLVARPVTIYDLKLLSYTDTTLRLEVTCSKGTYIRALARDIAQALGTPGHLSALTRTRVGPFDLSSALTLDAIATQGVSHALLPASRAIPDAPPVTVSFEDAARLANGRPVGVSGLRADHVWVYDPDGRLVCLGAADGTLLRSRLAL